MEIRIDFDQLVNEVADGFEKANEMTVTWGGRRALIEPALPYQGQVEDELRSGRIDLNFLQSSIFQVLDNAKVFLELFGRKVIDKEDVQESMRRYCPYLFWC